MKHKREEVSESEASDNYITRNGFFLNNSRRNFANSSNEQVTPSFQRKNEILKPIKEYKQQNPDCETYSLEDSIDRENEDVYLLELPKAIDVSWLIGKPINFEDSTKLKIFKKKFLIDSINQRPREVNLQTRKLRSVPIRKTFAIREYIKHRPSLQSSLDTPIFKSTLPENLKIRHPLFGADYKNKVVLDDSVVAKLDNLIKESSPKKKKTKKKDKKTIEEPVENVNETIFGLLENHLSQKRKEDVTDLSEPATKSKKHKKYSSMQPPSENISIVSDPNQIKKKQKKKPKEKPIQIKIEPPSPPPYKKKNYSNFANSTVLNSQLPIFDMDLSQIDNSSSLTVKPKKLKKERRLSTVEVASPKSKIRMKKEKMSDSQSNYVDDALQFEDSVQKSVKTKKSKEKYVSTTGPLNDIGKRKKIKSEYFSEAEDETLKKKRRRVKSECQHPEDDHDELVQSILQNLKSEFAKSF